MEKIIVESENVVSKNVEKIGALFPNCITETRGEDGKLKKAINFETLQQMLSEDVIEGDESYEFTWVGKKASIAEANRPIQKTLRPCPEESVNWDTTENLYIEGDNLQVLKLLQKSYLGKVKMIYIDPPYNTGKDFVYNDNFAWSADDWDIKSGRIDEEGNYLFKNTESNGRFHSDWCSMMHSRLWAAWDLLQNDGAIFINIDEGELFNLKKICDEVFGSHNFCNVISVKTKVAGVSGSYMGKSLQNNTEYILFYCKDASKFLIDKMPKKRQELMSFIQAYADEGKSWKYTSVLVSVGSREYIKSITAGNGDEIRIYAHNNYEIQSINQVAEREFGGDLKKAYYSYIDKVFRTTNAQSSIRASVMQESKDIASNLISIDYIPTKGKNAGQITTIYYKDAIRNMVTYLKEVVSIEKDGIFKLDNAGNLWDDINYNNLSNEAGISFPNGQKPLQLLQRLIEMIDCKDEIVLDFFSGSATTAHAVIQMNSEDKYNRKFIMVQIAEDLDVSLKTATDKDVKSSIISSINFLDEINKPHFITELGKERIRRAGKKINPLGIPDLDVGFRVLKLDDWNKKDVEKTPAETSQADLLAFTDNLRDDRSDLDLLFGCLIDSGLELTKPITSEDIEGCAVYSYNEDWLIGCFAENVPNSVIRQIAARKPRKAIFRDSSFADSPSKINVTEVFKMISPDTQLRVI